MANSFASYSQTTIGPASNAETVTPNDSTDLPNTPRALICGSAGTVTVDMDGMGSNIAIPVVAGPNPYIVTRVYATGTDVGTIIAVW